ncbi:hypothetical protein ACHWQZ_G018978 [Mnemiopsis leidyi]
MDSALDTKAADSKKKKSTFRITSIIDPVKNDDEDEDKTEDAEENEEPIATASRFKVIKSQTPNPRTFKTGRWKVKEMYLLELSNHKDTREGTANSIASNESGGAAEHCSTSGENTRCQTPLSQSSGNYEKDTFTIPDLESFTADHDSFINSCLKQYKEKYETLHVAATELHQKFLKLKQERDRYRDETVSLKEEIRRLKTR